MARPKKASTRRKSRIVTFRLPEDRRDQLTKKAANAGVTLTDLIVACLDAGHAGRETAQTDAQPANDTVQPMAPEVFAELRRIGNNINQIAHAVNSGLPPEFRNAYRQAARLVDLLIADEFSIRRNALRTRTAVHGTAHSQTGIELQGGVRLYPARPGQEDS